jgi:hypothetical protein
MATGSVAERPPSSLPSGEKIVWFRYPSFKKRTLENKNNLGEEDLCTKHGVSISACSVELWEQMKLQTKRAFCAGPRSIP